MLNLVELSPGQALRLDAGNLHAYLRGAGIELMGASDNRRSWRPHGQAGRSSTTCCASSTRPPWSTRCCREVNATSSPAPHIALARLEAGDRHLTTGHELAIDAGGATWYLPPGETIVSEQVTYVATPM